ncbi:TPA: PD-(D/E)XK motif protein [Serratia marcescens]
MMNKSAPWDEIHVPDADYNVRLAADLGAVPVYWGKDSSAHCLLIIELEGKHREQFLRDRTSVHGLHLDLRRRQVPGREWFVLTLERDVDSDIFLGLCETLISSLREVKDASAALAVALAHIKRWKAFLAGRSFRILSAEEIRGLFAELQFLRLLYNRSTLDQHAAVEAWCGAERLQQDFVFGDTAVEVKSLSGKERCTVRISSEDQLASTVERLFLMTFRLRDGKDSDVAQSLNSLVAVIESELSDADALEGFSARLAAYGYAPLHEYNLPLLVVTSKQAYQVDGDFPRLIRAELPNGIIRLSYEIELEKILPYLCEAEILFRDS